MLKALRQRFRRSREPCPTRRALVLAGGGIIGGMYEVGALAALDEALPEFRVNNFDLYVGSSSGSVVSALMANTPVTCPNQSNGTRRRGDRSLRAARNNAAAPTGTLTKKINRHDTRVSSLEH